MRRWLFNIAAGFSLLLFVATCVLWVRSFWVWTSVKVDVTAMHEPTKWIVTNTWLIAQAEHGTIQADITEQDDDNRTMDWSVDVKESGPKTWTFGRRKFRRYTVFLPGFKYGRVSIRTPMSAHEIPRTRHELEITHTLIALVFALLPAAWLLTFRWRRARRRTTKGLCTACGYDMRGSDGTCPECGAENAYPKSAT